MQNYLIDTHCHINYIEGFNFDEIIQSANAHGVNKILVPAACRADFEKVIELCENFPQVFGYIGIHPEEVNNWSDDTVTLIKQFAGHKKIVGIGEIGLDYYWDKSTAELQKEVFIEQIKIANDFGLPINVHSREAAKDTFDILAKYNKNSTVIMHCFSGSVEFAKECVRAGMYIALGGVVTFKNAINAKEVAKTIPLERLLLETDAPYMAPTPMRGQTNLPAYVKYVAEEIAKLREITFEDVANATTNNAERILNI